MQSELARLRYRLAIHAQQVSALSRRVRNTDALRQVSNVVAERLELDLKLGAKVVKE
jgi:hypothetical protein